MGLFTDVNRVELIGNITQDLELKYTPKGTAILDTSIATNRQYKSGDEWKTEVQFTNIQFWGATAAQIAQWAQKGTKARVIGRIVTQEWVDKESQKKRYKTFVIGEDFTIMAKGRTKEEVKAGAPKGESNDVQEDLHEPMPADGISETIDPEDLPF